MTFERDEAYLLVRYAIGNDVDRFLVLSFVVSLGVQLLISFQLFDGISQRCLQLVVPLSNFLQLVLKIIDLISELRSFRIFASHLFL